jgi:hypothetical protein
MAEEIKSIPITFANKGIILKSAPDEIPIDAYTALVNVFTDQENSLAVRKGFARLNAGLPSVPYSSYLMKDYDGNIWRYVIAGRQLYIAQVYPTPSDFVPVSGGSNLSSGSDPRAFFANYTLSGIETKPYMIMADGTVFLKHPGDAESLRRIGIPRPEKPLEGIVIVPTEDTVIEACEDYTEWTGGDAAAVAAPYCPTIWWVNSPGVLGPRWYYAKHTFIDGSAVESCPSGISNPYVWIPPEKAARIYWKKPDITMGYSAQYGGGGGFAFTDGLANFPAGARVYQIKINHGTYIDRIQLVYQSPDGTLTDGPSHGGPGGSLTTITLDDDEYVTGINGKYGTYVDSMVVTTNKRITESFGGTGGTTAYSITIPAGTATVSNLFIGFIGRSIGSPAIPHPYVHKIGLAYVINTFDASDTAPVGSVSWNLYIGTDPDNLRLANTTPMALTDVYDEPSGGIELSPLGVPLCNKGTVSADAAGKTGNAIQIDITGDGVMGRATKAFTNSYGNTIVIDMGSSDPGEYIKVWVKFNDAEALANAAAIKIILVVSDIPGDTGAIYQYFATGTFSDFDTFVVGAWTEIQIAKTDFVFLNNSGETQSTLGWNTISGIGLEIDNIDPATGGETNSVSFDSVIYSPTGKLVGSDLQWAYTYYDSKTDTESDLSDVFLNDLGPLTDQQVNLYFPPCPFTTPPLANPDKIRVYRMGGTVTQYQLVAEIDYVAGGSPPAFLDNVPDSELGDPAELDNQLPVNNVLGLEVADNRLWTWGGSYTDSDGNVIPEPPNRLRFSKRVRIELFPAENYIYVGAGSEQIQRVMEHDGELFVFTLTRVYRISGSTLSDYTAGSTAVNQGLINPHGLARGTRGLYMQAYDGIYEYPSGRKISEPINQVFKNETMNSMPGMIKDREYLSAMAFWDSKLYFSFPMSSDATVKNDGTYVWDMLYERWHFYGYGAQCLFNEPNTNILVGCNLAMWASILDGPTSFIYGGNWALQLEEGFVDYCADGVQGISWIVDTKDYDLGMPDQEKHFIDYVFDVDTQGYAIDVQLSFDGASPDPMGSIITSGREQKILPILVGESEGKFCRRTRIRMLATTLATATGLTRFYKIIHRILVEPIRHRTFVTQWDDCGIPTQKYFRELMIELDTFGAPLEEIQVQVDQALATTIRANTTSTGRQRFFYGLPPDIRGTLVRLKIVPTGENEVKVYAHKFNVLEEPALINSFQMPWSEEQWPYPKLWKEVILDIDTNNVPIGFDFWLDGAIKESFDVQCATRQLITHSLEKDSFGKLGRITVDEDYLDPFCCLPQGVRVYSVRYVTDKDPADVTFSDTYEQLMNYDRTKIIRRFWIAMKNPDSDVTMELYADDVLASTKTITADRRSTGHSKIRVDLESAIRGRLFRLIFSSSFAFQLYWEKSEVEIKNMNGEDGYARIKLVPPQSF